MAGPSTTVTGLNILAGPAALYVGDYGAVEPADTAVNAAPAASAWRDLGATNDGLTVTVGQEFFVMTVDQVPDVVGRRMTQRDVRFATNLAEATLDNLAMVVNDAESASGAGYRSVTFGYGLSAMFPTYRASIVDGYAPGISKRRRFIARKVLSVESVETAYKKDGMTLYPVTFGCHFVDSNTPPTKTIDEV